MTKDCFLLIFFIINVIPAIKLVYVATRPLNTYNAREWKNRFIKHCFILSCTSFFCLMTMLLFLELMACLTF